MGKHTTEVASAAAQAGAALDVRDLSAGVSAFTGSMRRRRSAGWLLLIAFPIARLTAGPAVYALVLDLEEDRTKYHRRTKSRESRDTTYRILRT